MSNETDAKNWLLNIMGEHDFTVPNKAFNRIVARLRGEAAQPCPHESWDENGGWRKCNDCGHGWSATAAPAPVAGDALRQSLREMLELRDAGQEGRLTEKHELDIVRDARAALSTQPALSAPSEQVAARQINREFVEAVKQLCRDYSDRQNRPYMGDVFAQLDYLAEQLDMTVAPSEQVAGDAVMSIIDKWMDGYDHLGTGDDEAEEEDSRREWATDRAAIIAALAQDRAAQPKPADQQEAR